MAHDTYQVPESSLSDIRADLDAVQYSPEKQPEPYQVVKDIEEKILRLSRRASCWPEEAKKVAVGICVRAARPGASQSD